MNHRITKKFILHILLNIHTLVTQSYKVSFLLSVLRTSFFFPEHGVTCGSTHPGKFDILTSKLSQPL
jgi:hypothetical protein